MSSPERRSRRIAIAALGAMIVICIALGGVSFAGSRHRLDPDAVSFGGHGAVSGKRVFQAYSCLDCPPAGQQRSLLRLPT